MSGPVAEYGDQVSHRIYLIRGQRVMLSTDFARLYQVAPKVLIQAVKRNLKRFPSDFMFRLEPQEVARSRSQIVTLNDAECAHSGSGVDSLQRGHNVKYPPYAFTEQGVAMLSSVLKTERAILVNVAIMRAFVKLRETLAAHTELARKLAELEHKIVNHDESIQTLFDAIRQLMAEPEPPPKQIGFHVRERRARYSTSRSRRP